MKKHLRRLRISRRARRILLVTTLSLVGVFVLTNAVLWAMYRNRTYPHTRVMDATIGSVIYSDLSQNIEEKKLLPETMTLTAGDQRLAVPLEELGIIKDIRRTTDSANKQRAWLPIRNLWKKPVLQAPIRVEASKLSTAIDTKLAKALRKDAVSARLTLNGVAVDIEEGKDGFELNKSSLQKSLIASLDAGKATLNATVTPTKPAVSGSDLQDDRKNLEAQLQTQVAFVFGSKSKQASSSDVASWYVPSGDIFTPAPDKIQAFIAQTGKEFGIRIKDIGQVTNSTVAALQKHEALRYTLIEQTALKTYAYCVSTRGVDAAHLPGLRSQLINTFGDARGWSIGNIVEFKEASSGCNFTVWLSEASQMPSFGAICDALWSCNVGSNVVINFDRWQNASTAWNTSGGSLTDYRHMVINHETGHYLGFGHSSCPGPGQKAPVMQQQSIDLQGCSFNAWPTAGEQGTLRNRLGI